jgi:N-acetylglutamate synthase-like GNAT family acetyltransferase
MITVQEAKKKDFEEIQKIIAIGVREGKILKRTKKEIQNLIQQRNLITAKENEIIVGIVALDYYSKRFSELRTLFILPEHRSNGIGGMLVDEILKKAKQKKIKEIMTITTKETSEWFKKHKFGEAAHELKVALFKEI